MKYFISIVLTLGVSLAMAQVSQNGRYEMEKKNTDDYFTVLSAGKDGAVIFRDIDDFRKGEGDIWKIVSLDTDLNERWDKEIGVDIKYTITAYELKGGHLYLIFRKSEFSKSDYYIVKIGLLDGEVERFDISNEVELELRHIILVNDKLIFGGYVRFSPTLMSYEFGDDKFEVIPGFFKDKSDILDLRSNNNSTFNVVTQEKDYQGYFLRLRTYSERGDILFEREIHMPDGNRVLSAKSTGLEGGNIAIMGAYGLPNSHYSQGIYSIVAKPQGQKNVINQYAFSDFEHFFDYMKPSRAGKIKERVKKKAEEGKDFKYSSRILLNEAYWNGEGYLVSAEVYRPTFEQVSRSGYYGWYGNPFYPGSSFYNGQANSRYVRQSSQFANAREANSFEYYESVVIQLDEQGRLQWDNSFTIEDIETMSLERVVDIGQVGKQVKMMYLQEEKIKYKIIQKGDTVMTGEQKIALSDESDEIKHTYTGMGGTVHWYNNVFFIWGYHRVENKVNNEGDPRRNVLFINKLTFE